MEMKVLMHYTISEYVYNLFESSGEITYSERVKEIENFYSTYNRNHENLFFIIAYTNNLNVKYRVGKITYKNNRFCFNKVRSEISNILIEELGIKDNNTYEKDYYYKVLHIDDDIAFRNKKLDQISSKIKLKYFSWRELTDKNDILFKKISNLIFEKGNIINLATTYTPDAAYDERLIVKKCFSALKNLGFIKKGGIDTTHTILQGDIGEFLMHCLVSEFLESNSDKYIYPKLIFKTNPTMAVYGNDGSIYIPEKKEIYYLEAKFYNSLTEALNRAVDSLEKHNDDLYEDLNYSAELFRNIKTNRTHELIEITDDVTEKLIIFLICADTYQEEKVKKIIEKNCKVKKLKEKFEVLIFVLPILDKENFLKFFKIQSELEGEKYYDFK
ncbi:Hachiman antiphage defense system protein HamA [Listeria seeligeri]|uniref:Hachiman antiphage defense system protein HamA n=1 Tax=Listeria seeligeri TaxID=1640 RepID=UPI0019442263|nr:Hachiman antiphage defense system protein HamA [Listeria seeligeri]MBM5610253.1 DUF1837 domain-containing protein [Listeria seeligeri]